MNLAAPEMIIIAVIVIFVGAFFWLMLRKR